MQTETQTTELIKFEEINSLIASAPDVLAKNQSLHDKAVNKAISLLDTVEAEGMNDELDAELNDWMVKAGQALKINNQRRSPLTQMLTQVAKVFTSLEAPFDGTKKDSYYARFQILRNGYAAEKAKIQREKEAAILKQQNIDKEKISIKAEIELQIRNSYYDKLQAFKKYWTDFFNNTTLETLKANKEKIENIKLDYPKDKFNELPVKVYPVYLDNVEKDRLIGVARVELYQELSANFRENMESLRDDLKDKFPSKKRELEAIAKAGAEEKARLEELARNRQLAEQKLAEEEAEKKRKEAEKQVEMNKQMETAGTLFDTAAQLEEVKESTGKVKASYKISVTDATGWGHIFLFWCEKEGYSLTEAQIEKKTFKQLKTFCEKWANKHDEFIDHDSIEYYEDLKAVVTK